jgi:hypothetical protein
MTEVASPITGRSMVFRPFFSISQRQGCLFAAVVVISIDVKDFLAGA